MAGGEETGAGGLEGLVGWGQRVRRSLEKMSQGITKMSDTGGRVGCGIGYSSRRKVVVR